MIELRAENVQRFCGCKITGNGTDRLPLAIHFCPLHENAADLARVLDDFVDASEIDAKGRVTVFRGSFVKARQEAKYVLAKARS